MRIHLNSTGIRLPAPLLTGGIIPHNRGRKCAFPGVSLTLGLQFHLRLASYRLEHRYSFGLASIPLIIGVRGRKRDTRY